MLTAHLRLRLFRCLAAWALLLTPGRAAAAEPPPPGLAAGAGSSQTYGNSQLSACSSNANGSQVISTTTFVSLVECSLNVAEAGHLVVLTSASVGLVNAGDRFEATFRLDHNNGGTGDSRTERVVDAYPDTGLLPGTDDDGTDRNVAITGYYTVTAGTHALKLLVKRSEGTTSMRFTNATLSVLFIADSTDLLTCGGVTANGWLTDSSSYSNTANCSLNIPGPGRVFVSADGWMKLGGAGAPPYEAAHRLSLDSPGTSIRYTNVYTNTGSLSGDGVDATVAGTQVFTVTPGVHVFTLEMKRQSGPGSAFMTNPGLAVLYVPDNSPYASTCGAVGTSTWTNATTTYTALATCTLETPANGWVFMSGNAGIGRSDTAYEGRFGVARDSLTAEAASGRFVNSYTDTGDGLDGMTTTALILPSTAGTHTYRLVGRRYAGTGTVLARTGVLFVLAPGASVYLPLAVK